MLRQDSYGLAIANTVKLKPSTITGHLQRMQRDSLIQLDSYSSRKIYHLTEKGLALLLDDAKPSQPVSNHTKPLPAQTLRIHSLGVAFELRTPLSTDEPQKLLQSKGVLTSFSGLKNQLSGYTKDALLTPSSLIVYMPELSVDLHSDPRLAIQPHISLAIRKAIDYEQLLGIQLKRLDKDTLSGTIVMNHNANTNNEVAKTILDKLKKFEVRDETGRLRLIVDASDGIPEFEAVDAKYAIEDITKAQDFYLATIQGRFDYRKDQELLHQTISLLNHYAKTFVQHEEAYRENINTNKETQKTMKEFRKYIESLKQRRL